MAGFSDHIQPPKPGDPIRADDIAAVVAHAKRLGAQAGAFVSGGVTVSRSLSRPGKGGGSFWLGVTLTQVSAAQYRVSSGSGAITGIQSLGSGSVRVLAGLDGGNQTVKNVIPAIIPDNKLVVCGIMDGEETILAVVGS